MVLHTISWNILLQFCNKIKRKNMVIIVSIVAMCISMIQALCGIWNITL